MTRLPQILSRLALVTVVGCQQVRLVSRVSRLDAHRFYLRKGMNHEANYFSLNL
jgi:hypothetical protein